VAVGAFAIGVGAALVGASAAMGDPGPPSTAPSAPAPPTSSTGSGGPSTITTTTQASRPTDQTPPPRAHDLRVTAPKPGQIVLTWRLVHRSDIASVWVNRGPASRCPQVPVASPGFYAGRTIGPVGPRSRQVDKGERDTKNYCYAVFTLDKAGNWAKPVTHLIRNPGDTTPPVAVTGLTATFGKGGAVRLAWTNPPDAAHDVVVRGPGSTCPQFTTDGTPIGTHALRRSEVDSSVPTPGKYCYAVFAYDAAGNHSPVTTSTVEPPATTTPTQTSPASPPPSQSGSSLSSVVAIIGGGALVLAGLAYATLRLVRREWEWHARTGYGIRDLVSIDVRASDRLALIIPAIIGVCITGAVVVLVLSL
jgi:hypothetical protein